jgi:capsular polysaccharide biosynthesis protein
MERSRGWRKLLVELKRRGWVVVLAVLVATGVSVIVGNSLPEDSTAEAVLVVRADGPLAEQPGSSKTLAGTYAALIPLDARIEKALYRHLPRRTTSYSTSNDPNTAILRLTVTASSAEEAVEGTVLIAKEISGQHPVSPNILDSSISIARLPQSVETSSTAKDLLLLGAILGLLLGLVLLGFWRPRDARVDTLRELRAALACPCFEIHLPDGKGLRPLFDALASKEPERVLVVPCQSKQTTPAAALARVLQNAFGAERVVGSAVLVATPGIRRATLAEAEDALRRYGLSLDYAVLSNEDAGQAATGGPATEDAPAQVAS